MLFCVYRQLFSVQIQKSTRELKNELCFSLTFLQIILFVSSHLGRVSVVAAASSSATLRLKWQWLENTVSANLKGHVQYKTCSTRGAQSQMNPLDKMYSSLFCFFPRSSSTLSHSFKGPVHQGQQMD